MTNLKLTAFKWHPRKEQYQAFAFNYLADVTESFPGDKYLFNDIQRLYLLHRSDELSAKLLSLAKVKFRLSMEGYYYIAPDFSRMERFIDRGDKKIIGKIADVKLLHYDIGTGALGFISIIIRILIESKDIIKIKESISNIMLFDDPSYNWIQDVR